MRVSLRRPPQPNLTLNGVTIGFGKQKPTCGDHIALKPEEVRWLPDGRIDFDVVYGYKENNGVNAAGFENAMLWISDKEFCKGKKPRVVHSVQNIAVEGFGTKTVEAT